MAHFVRKFKTLSSHYRSNILLALLVLKTNLTILYIFVISRSLNQGEKESLTRSSNSTRYHSFNLLNMVVQKYYDTQIDYFGGFLKLNIFQITRKWA